MKRCEKCGYISEQNKQIKINNNEIFICQICSKFSPNNEKLESYLKEKIDWKQLESFRRFSNNMNKNIAGMHEKAKQGNVMSRAAFGYNLVDKQLIPNEHNKILVQEIFMTFLNENISLNQLSKRYSLSINGLKKILRNFTYIGKVKFDGQIMPGKHPSLISAEIFNKVQDKLELLGIKN